MSNKAPPQKVEPAPNVRKIIGPDPTASLVQVFAAIDEYQLKEREKFAQQLAAIGKANSDGVFAGIDEYQRKEREIFAQMLAAIGKADSDGQQAPQGTTAQNGPAPQGRPPQDRDD